MNEVLSIVWSKEAFESLKKIHDYYFKLNPAATERIRKDIIAAVSSLRYTKQYQLDEFNSNYRRIIVRYYKVFYTISAREAMILEIFDTRQSPSKSRFE
ncbi:type II toxin-antitoxin system RelE/ParE family toxin [Roseivirga pacifica]|uniref:type II toxin-antitoxin system RelE/ParE family toxin n=1 Tax=Roseivirga pacifica TaxID=1267423 RepID=UPI003BB0EDEE